MKQQIICLNPKCNEVPLISLIYSNNCHKIKTDCRLHHYKYELEEYLFLIKNQEKEYSTKCTEHNEKYKGFLIDFSFNVCNQCLVEEKEKKIILFEEIKPSKYNNNKFHDNSLSQLYSIIYQNFIEAKNKEKLVAQIYLNYEYMNSYKEEESIKIDEINLIEKGFPLSKDEDENWDDPFKTNLKYMIRCISNTCTIEIFNIDENKYIYNQNKKYKNIKIELSPFYYDIFLTVEIKEIKIWKIFENEIQIQSTICLIDKVENFTFAKFSPLNEKVIITVCDDCSIKIWNLEKIFYIHEIKCINYAMEKIIFPPNNESIIGFSNNTKIFIYDIISQKIIYNIKKDIILYFNFIDSENVIIIDKKNIEIYNYKTKLLLKTITNNYRYNDIYYQKDGLLYILNEHLSIINLYNNNSMKKYENINNNVDDIIFIENKYMIEKYCLLNFLVYNKNKALLFSLNKNNSQIEGTKNELKMNSNYFLKKNKRTLYPESELSFNKIINEKNEIYLKKYFENEKIKDNLMNNFNIDLKQKKINVEKSIKDYKPKETIEEEYTQLLSLLIQDNTNKILIKKYLLFLQKNEYKLKNLLKIEAYEDEYNYYSVIFTCDEIKNNFNKIKFLSEKEKFINLLKEIKDLSEINYNNYKNTIDKSKLGRFNQKINFYQNNELYWYRNTNLVLYSLTKLSFQKFNKIQYCIQQVLNRELLNEKIIIENKDRLSILIINLIMPQSKNAYDYNLNLISSFRMNSEQEFEELLLKKGFINNNGKFFLSNEKNIELDPKKDKDICIDNYILNKRKNLNLLNYQLLNYDKIYDNFYLKIDISKVKSFLSKFLVSNLFKEIYYYLYPDNIIFPFKDLKSAEEFMNENLNFLHMINEEAHGATDKFTLEIYMYLLPKKFYYMPKDFDQNDKDNLFFLSGLMTGELIKTGIHEINHDMYNIYYYHSNGTISLKTPRKIINGKDLRESGREIEILLFGDKLYSINIKQVLYLVNEKNYDKGIIEFRKGFKELNDEDLNIIGIFSDFNRIKNSKYFNDPDNFSISTSSSNELFLIDAVSDYDTL